MFQFIRKAAGALRLGYDATVDTKRRKQASIKLKSEDEILPQRDRDKLVSIARDLRRNSEIVAWMVRRHLYDNATFTFQCRTGNAEFDQRVEDLMTWWSRPLNCDVTGRHSLDRLIKIAEGLAFVEGDVLIYKLSDGRIQIIEGDRIRTPTNAGDFKDIDISKFVNGVETSPSGRPLRYAICERKDNGFVLKELVQAKHVFHHGYFDRIDTIRGISRLAPAINTFRDLHESAEYALQKMKVSQFFALKLKRAAGVEPDDDGSDYSFDFGDGPQMLDLDPNDDADFLESNSPADQFQSFFKSRVMSALKSGDIPYSFYDESHTNYSGARQALVQYDQSAEDNRQNIRDRLLTPLTIWRLRIFIEDGVLVLPVGMGIDDIKFEWIGAKLPWIDPKKEADGFEKLLSLNLTTHQAICKSQGEDWNQIVEQKAREHAKVKELGLASQNNTENAIVADPSEDDQGEENVRNKVAA